MAALHPQTETSPTPGYPAGEELLASAATIASLHSKKHNRLAFWKVTSVGLCIGLSLGAALGFAFMEQLLALLAMGDSTLVQASIYGVGMLTFGLAGAGAGFGYATKKQDIEKHMLFLNYVAEAASASRQADFIDIAPKQDAEISSLFPITTMLYPDDGDNLIADTHERDQVLVSARKALLSMDHTKITSH